MVQCLKLGVFNDSIINWSQVNGDIQCLRHFPSHSLFLSFVSFYSSDYDTWTLQENTSREFPSSRGKQFCRH